METWITQPSASPCALHQRQKLRRYFGSTGAPFIACASNTAFLGEFTDAPMPSFSGDWKRTVFYRRRLLARSEYLVGQSGAGARGSELLTTLLVVSGKALRGMCRTSTKQCRSELGCCSRRRCSIFDHTQKHRQITTNQNERPMELCKN